MMKARVGLAAVVAMMAGCVLKGDPEPGPPGPPGDAGPMGTMGDPGPPGDSEWKVVSKGIAYNPIDTGDYVGIGTDDPQETLHVVGSIMAEDDGSGVTGRVVMKGNHQYEWFPDGVGGPGSLALYDRTADSSPVVVLGDGNVGIGKQHPAVALDVAGQIMAGGGMCCSSDARLKQNIAPLPSALTRLLRLRGVTYEWKEPEEHGNLRGRQMGMIAQEVEQVFPEWIGIDANGYKTLTYRGFEALTVESLRDLKAENDRLKAENTGLTGKLASFEERLATLERRGGIQRANALGGSQWFGGAMIGAAFALVPWWIRRKRRPNETTV